VLALVTLEVDIVWEVIVDGCDDEELEWEVLMLVVLEVMLMSDGEGTSCNVTSAAAEVTMIASTTMTTVNAVIALRRSLVVKFIRTKV